MKNVILASVFFLTSLSVPTVANATTSIEENSQTELAYCEISDGGFYARGNCKRVLRAYRAWKVMQRV